MRQNIWKLQDAKNHFSEVVQFAMNEGPQEVTKRGEHAVVILSYEMYQQLTQPQEDIVDFFQNSPLKGVDLEMKRNIEPPRDIEL